MPAPNHSHENFSAHVIGFIDSVNESGIYGWAYDKTNPNAPLAMQFLIDGEMIATITCDQARPDVHANGHASAIVGFEAAIPERFCGNRQHNYWFTTRGGENIAFHSFTGSAAVIRSFRLTAYFDAEFYTRHYKDCQGLSRKAAHQHWKSAQGRHPTPQSLLDQLDPQRKSSGQFFSSELYRFLHPHLAPHLSLDWEAELHYIQHRESFHKFTKLQDAALAEPAGLSALAPKESKNWDQETTSEAVYRYFSYTLRKNGIISDKFLTRLNVTDYVTMNATSKLTNRLACAIHFADVGYKIGAALSFESRFDAAFVAEFDESYAGISPIAAYLRWVNEGIEQAVPPNKEYYLKRLGLESFKDYPQDFNAAAYLARHPELRDSRRSKWALLAHFTETGDLTPKYDPALSAAYTEIFRVMADNAAIQGDLVTAKRYYEQVLDRDPANGLGLRHYADCLLRLGEHFQAAAIYRRSITEGKASIWTYLNLAACYQALGRFQDACDSLMTACKTYPASQLAQERLSAFLRTAFERLSDEALWCARQKFYGTARELMADACGLLAAPFENLPAGQVAAPARIERIALVADMELPQCTFYRVSQKAEQLGKNGVTHKVYDYRTSLDAFTAEIPWMDAVIFYRVPATPAVMDAIYRSRQAGLVCFYEIDDLLFEPGLFPDRFESYGGQIDHDLYAQLVVAPQLLRPAMQVCDFAIASTTPLAQKMKPIVARQTAFVHRNGLSDEHAKSYMPAPAKAAGEVVRIFYGSGTKAHNEDFEQALATPLAGLFRKWQRKIELVVMGYLTIPAELKPFASQIRVLQPNWNLSAYWAILQEMDINIAVLKPGSIADCKSEIKWLEAAAFAIPSIVSATKTYGECLVQNQTGIIVQEKSEWFAALDSLIADRKKRQEMGRAAFGAVMNKYSPAQSAKSIARILNAVAGKAAHFKTKLLIAHVFFYPQLIGGATRVVMDNIAEMIKTYKDEFDIEVFTTIEGAAAPYMATSYLWEGIKVTAVTTPARDNLNQSAWDDQMAGFFTKTLGRFKPDLVHFHCIQRLTASLCHATQAHKVPYFITVHDGWWISEHQFLINEFGAVVLYNYANPLEELNGSDSSKLERMRIKQKYLSAAEKIIAVSEPFAEIYRKCGFANIAAVQNGVSPLALKPRLPAAAGKVRLAHLGGTEMHKGYHILQAAFMASSFQNLTLLVIDHAMEPHDIRHAQWGNTAVTFRGKFPQGEMGDLYCQVDVLIAPSVWPESFGLVAREAAAAGCWVVTSNRGAIGLDVRPDNGFVIDVTTPKALVEVLQQIDRQPEMFLKPPPPGPAMRTAAEQVEELVQLYRGALAVPVAKPMRR